MAALLFALGVLALYMCVLFCISIAVRNNGIADVGYGFASPVLITFLLLKVSGVPLLEKRWEGNPAWEAYKAKTSVFIPWILK